MKIKSAEEVLDIIGKRPRAARVILANGVFDLVHPGHLRHLRYAKSKADILIVAVTADRHIVKADYRPYVPEQLRAENLAELQCVDYVVIDDHATALPIIACLQPDYYCKGFEYESQNIVEVEAVESYGGQVIFTPGDVVYSSSGILENSRPDLKLEKLLTLMRSAGLDFGDIAGALTVPAKVHVVGDTIVDAHTYCTPLGGITKTPTMSLRSEEEQWFIGGAGIIARHMKAAGAQVTLSTVLGDDEAGEFAWDDLTGDGISLANINNSAPTTFKNVFIADGYRMLKVDTVDNRPIGRDIVKRLQEQIADIDADIVLLTDFRHGIFNRETTPKLLRSLPARAFTAADSQVASRWGNILDFQDMDLITPNEREARFALGDQDSIVRKLVLDLARKSHCGTLILKLGERGILTCAQEEKFYGLDSFARKVVDPVGAGDALLAYSALAMHATGNALIASVLGSIAAAIECECEGNVPVSAEEVKDRIGQLEAAS
jgi:rfaE bifunctional protein kinase chain/domain/rfaE bifunctional protein nucleotidyltransferase chain/domain